MGSQHRTEAFKKLAVQKFLSRGGRPARIIAEEMGVSAHSLYTWSKEYAKGPTMEDAQKRPQDGTTQEKYKSVMDFDRLPVEGPERGIFLRHEGFHTAHIDLWRSQMQKGLDAEKSGASARSEMAELSRENRELKKELHRKNGALAETAALLVLKKKADLIWGTGENVLPARQGVQCSSLVPPRS
jgi:transposase-like protein